MGGRSEIEMTFLPLFTLFLYYPLSYSILSAELLKKRKKSKMIGKIERIIYIA